MDRTQLHQARMLTMRIKRGRLAHYFARWKRVRYARAVEEWASRRFVRGLEGKVGPRLFRVYTVYYYLGFGDLRTKILSKRSAAHWPESSSIRTKISLRVRFLNHTFLGVLAKIKCSYNKSKI
jgi:hypothetical protein